VCLAILDGLIEKLIEVRGICPRLGVPRIEELRQGKFSLSGSPRHHGVQSRSRDLDLDVHDAARSELRDGLVRDDVFGYAALTATGARISITCEELLQVYAEVEKCANVSQARTLDGAEAVRRHILRIILTGLVDGGEIEPG